MKPPRIRLAGGFSEETIKQARAAWGMSQSALASLLGVTMGTISRWELRTHEISHPRIVQLALMAVNEGLHIWPFEWNEGEQERRRWVEQDRCVSCGHPLAPDATFLVHSDQHISFVELLSGAPAVLRCAFIWTQLPVIERNALLRLWSRHRQAVWLQEVQSQPVGSNLALSAEPILGK